MFTLLFVGKMNSVRGTRTVRLQRKLSGLDFSVKGGREHGIPVVVSWIKERGAAGKGKVGGARSHTITRLYHYSRVSEPGR